jgi:hypothetical protein
LSTAAERIKAAARRDEAAAESGFVAPEGTEPTEPEPPEPEPAEPAEPEPTPGPAEPEPTPGPGVPETEPPEPEPEPETPQAGMGLSAEQAGELERATSAYYRKVAKVMGGEIPPECPTCNGLGFDLSGGQAAPDYRAASDKDTCDECDGLGGVLSGSKVPGSEVVRCERCKGAGYLVTGPVNVTNPEQMAPVVMALREGNADGAQAAALQPGDPGWEPWMGGGPEAP